MGKFIDLTHQKFGRLNVISFNRSENGKAYWNCVCDCNNETIVRGSHLKSKRIVSCGCYHKQKSKEAIHIQDLTGQHFGKLKVIKLNRVGKGRNAYWECFCDCGNISIVRADSLKSGLTKSCGCLSESYIALELKKYYAVNYNAIAEYKIVRNPKTNQYLPYDIYIPDGIFIEIHGQQHYQLTRWNTYAAKRDGRTEYEQFKYSKYKDRIKKRYAKQNGIYIEIDLRKIKSVEDAISYIESFF